MKTRWITARLTEAKSVTHQMPWERGARRQLFMARRALRDSGLSEAQVLRRLSGHLQSA